MLIEHLPIEPGQNAREGVLIGSIIVGHAFLLFILAPYVEILRLVNGAHVIMKSGVDAMH